MIRRFMIEQFTLFGVKIFKGPSIGFLDMVEIQNKLALISLDFKSWFSLPAKSRGAAR